MLLLMHHQKTPKAQQACPVSRVPEPGAHGKGCAGADGTQGCESETVTGGPFCHSTRARAPAVAARKVLPHAPRPGHGMDLRGPEEARGVAPQVRRGALCSAQALQLVLWRFEVERCPAHHPGSVCGSGVPVFFSEPVGKIMLR